MRARLTLAGVVVFVVILLALAVVRFRSARHPAVSSDETSPAETVVISGAAAGAVGAKAVSDSAPTNVYAHNLMLRKGPGFRIYVRWLRGQMVRTNPHVNPSFDEPDTFVLDVKTGVIRTNVGDLTYFLNENVANSPLSHITLSGDGDQIKLHGTLHKVIPLPIEMVATISVAPANRIQIHVTKLNLLKIPFKALLGGFHVNVASLFHPGNIAGIEVSENDIFLDTQKLLPPPHIRGQLTSVRVVNPDIEEIYGNAQDDVSHVAQWRNFLELHDGTLDFGKLTMRHVDLIMVDLSNDAWFDLDLAHYQDQLVNGYTRMTPQAGLQIFMPDLDKIPHGKANQNIGMEWLKNRNLPPPPEIVQH